MNRRGEFSDSLRDLRLHLMIQSLFQPSQPSTINLLNHGQRKKTPSDVTKMIKDHEVKLVDFKFTDLPGSWQHFTTTLTEYNEEIFTEGLGFDGSSIRGWKVINASDMLVIPDPTTAWIDIFNAEPTLSLICTIVDPITREPYDRDPRGIAEKAEAYLKSTGIADTAFFGPEAEFFIFDDVRFSVQPRIPPFI